MLDISLLKIYVRKKLSLGIKGKELSKKFKKLQKEHGNKSKALSILADEIVDGFENMEKLYESLYEKTTSNRLKNDEEIDENILSKEVHQTLAKLVADFNEKQVEFLISDDDTINILCGSVRSGKTWVSCFKFGLRVINSDKDSKFMMVAPTLKSLESNCFKYFKLFFGNNFTYSINNKRAFLCGHEIRLEGAPNERADTKITGDTLAGAFIDEIQKIPESFVKQTYARCSDGNGFLYGTCNPEHPQHWLHRDWIKGKDMKGFVKTWTFLVSDNKYLPKKYVDSLKILFTGIFYERNVLGKWIAAEGVVFNNFANNHDKFVIKEINKNDIAFAIAGLDFGGNRSGSSLVITGFYKDIKQGLVVLHSNKLLRNKGDIDPTVLNKWVIDNIQEFKNKYNIPIFNLYCDNAEQYLEAGVRNEIRKQGLGIPTGDAQKIAIMDRVNFTQRMMALGAFKVMHDCQTVINSFDELVYDEKSYKDKLLDNGTTDNDTWDAYSYSVERYIKKFNYIGG